MVIQKKIAIIVSEIQDLELIRCTSVDITLPDLHGVNAVKKDQVQVPIVMRCKNRLYHLNSLRCKQDAQIKVLKI